jgi:4'-phosphopantetheinyl transferase
MPAPAGSVEMAFILSPSEVHVWYCLAGDPPWDDVQQAYLTLLSPDERSRYDRFMFDKDRRQFLLARTLVRTLLSCYALPAPDDWEFATTATGKPYVAPRFGLPHLQFNHSHADALVACAITRQHDVGVDVESLDRQIHLGIARHCLSAMELQQFEHTAPQHQLAFLLRQWTLKEAYSKALGLGLSLQFVNISFAFDAQGTPRLVDDAASGDPHQWQFYQQLIDGRHYLAVAVRCPVSHPCQFIVRRSPPLLPPSGTPC